MINLKFAMKPTMPNTHRISQSTGFTGYDNDKDESFFCLIDDESVCGMIFYADGSTIGVDFNRYSDVEDYCAEYNMILSKCFENGAAFTIDILVKE